MPLDPAIYIPAVGGALQGAVTGVLRELNVEDDTIREIVAILDEHARTLGEHRPGALRAGAYGASGNGTSLEHHTALAHQHVFDAMTRMVENLTGTGERVRRFNDEVVFTDEDAADRYRSVADRAGAVPALWRRPAGVVRDTQEA